MNTRSKNKADVCLILEGTYPYVAGGVSAWMHEFIQAQPDKTFHLMALLPPNAETTMRYDVPDNVTGITNVFLQTLPEGVSSLTQKQEKALFTALELPLLQLQTHANLTTLQKVLDALAPHRTTIGNKILMESEASWQMLLRMYHATMGNSAFLDYFWSYRALYGGQYSLLLVDLPEADMYHALCTGYAGLMLARAHLETGKPCLVTEHGIYTNERRIEIASADWLTDHKTVSLSLQQSEYDRELRDFWLDVFSGYSRICYDASEQIITLYEGNQFFQLQDGADEDKLLIIPNGIDYDRYSAIARTPHEAPTIALIGRVVPIKDIKTFIRACVQLRNAIPNLTAYIMGPTEEDPDYYQECCELVEHNDLGSTITFTGKVAIDDYLGHVDVIVLTSISEAQPLVILEAGASGIPAVTTDVGACREMIEGASTESPALGHGGAVCPLANHQAIADELERLLTDKAHYDVCSGAIRQRVQTYYHKKDQHASYRSLYENVSAPATQQRKVS